VDHQKDCNLILLVKSNSSLIFAKPDHDLDCNFDAQTIYIQPKPLIINQKSLTSYSFFFALKDTTGLGVTAAIINDFVRK